MPISPLLNQNTSRNSSSIKTVFWRSPGAPWLEINTDGLAIGVIPESWFVGFFQGFNGAFTKPPYCGSGPCFADINAIQAVNTALSMGWQFVGRRGIQIC